MNRFITTFVAAVVISLSVSATPEASSRKYLTVLTANVGNMSVSSANHKRQYKISEYDLPVLKRNIEALSPAVVFLQEIDSRGKQQEKRIFSSRWSVRCSGDMCTAIDASKLEFIGGCTEGDGYFICPARVLKRVEVKETCAEEKGSFVCTATRKLDPSEVIKLFNAHTTSPFDDRDFSVRERQICAMLEDMKSQRGKKFRVLAAGDLNFDPKYESKAYKKKNDRDDSLFNLGVCWGNTFTAESSTGLKIISGDEPTWYMKKVKLFVVEELVMNTLDHVITDLPARGCRTLSDDKERLDADRSGKPKPRGTFMDHRALLCEVAEPQ